MSTKNCPETARQKMINMMYLVLTAMLALNIAAETLQAFKIVDNSLMKSYLNFTVKNNSIYNDFEAQAFLNKNKVEKWQNEALEVKQKTQEILDYILAVKVDLVSAIGSEKLDPDKELSKDDAIIVDQKGDSILIKSTGDLNISPEIMMTKGKGKELRHKIEEYRTFLISKIDTSNKVIVNDILKALDTSDPEKHGRESDPFASWEAMHFEANPLIAVVTLLTKMQLDVRNAESLTVSYLYSQIDASSFKFNKLEAQVIPKSTYVIQGQPFEADVFLSAVDTTQTPEIIANGQRLSVVNNRAKYSCSSNEPGVKTWSGFINYKNPDGNIVPYPFKGEYQVVKPSVTISPTKMNVFYLGIANPVSISIPGIPSDKIIATMTNGSIDKAGDDFVVKPASSDLYGKKTKITVKVKIDNQERYMGEMIFKVKEVPDPVAQVAGKSGGDIKAELLAVEQGVMAELINFDFDLTFEVQSFNISIPSNGNFINTWASKSKKFTPEQLDQLRKLKAGNLIYFDNIVAKGGDGSTRTLSPITFKIK